MSEMNTNQDEADNEYAHKQATLIGRMLSMMGAKMNVATVARAAEFVMAASATATSLADLAERIERRIIVVQRSGRLDNTGEAFALISFKGAIERLALLEIAGNTES